MKATTLFVVLVIAMTAVFCAREKPMPQPEPELPVVVLTLTDEGSTTEVWVGQQIQLRFEIPLTTPGPDNPPYEPPWKFSYCEGGLTHLGTVDLELERVFEFEADTAGEGEIGVLFLGAEALHGYVFYFRIQYRRES